MKTFIVTLKTSIPVSLLLVTLCASFALAAGPPTPTGLVATASLETHVALSWTAASGAISYNIYRSTTPSGEALFTTNILSNTFENSGLSNGTLYFYKVDAVNSSGTSRLSSEVSVTTKTAGATGIKATTDNSQVTLTWPSAPTATSYRIYRDTLGGPSGATNFVVTGSNSHTDTGLVNGTKYWYEVDAINASGENFAFA